MSYIPVQAHVAGHGHDAAGNRILQEVRFYPQGAGHSAAHTAHLGPDAFDRYEHGAWYELDEQACTVGSQAIAAPTEDPSSGDQAVHLQD